MEFISFDGGNINNILDEENFIALNFEFKEYNSLNSTSKRRALLDNLDCIIDNFKTYLMYLRLLLLYGESSTNYHYHNSFTRFMKKTLSLEDGDSHEYLDGIYTFDVFRLLGALPVNISESTIDSIREASNLLNYYGELTIPNEFLNYIKDNIDEDSDFDCDQYEMDLEDIFYNLSSDPCSAPSYNFKISSLTMDQIDFLISYNDSQFFDWFRCKLHSEPLNKFIQKFKENKEMMEELYAKLRSLLNLYATNLVTISNFKIVDVGFREPVYTLECLIFQNRCELPDLYSPSYSSFKELQDLLDNINELLNNHLEN